MDFFSILNPDLNTPAGILVKTGTDPLLLGPDWTKNLELCDHVNQFNDGADAIKAILCQLKSSEQKSIELAMAMLETLMKNCKSIPFLISRGVMEELVSIANGKRGHRNQDEALRLIQSWGRTFEKRRSELPIFYDTFMMLKSKGAPFPQLDSQDVMNSPTSVSSTGPSSQRNEATSSIRNATTTQAQQSSKLQQDLKVVLEKVRLCREMLPESPGISQDEILAEVVGFLESCQERLNDLIEAGSAGVLGESDMEMCFKVHEAVLKTLEAEKNGTSIPVEDESLFLPTGNQQSTTPSEVKKPSTMKASLLEEEEEDAFSNLTLKTPSSSSATSTSRQVPVLAPPRKNVAPSAIPAPQPGPSSASAPPPLPPPSVTQPRQDDLLSLFSSPPAAPQNPPPSVPPSIGSQGMTDDEFEKFLNG